MYKRYLICCLTLGISLPSVNAADFPVPVVDSASEVPVYRSSPNLSAPNIPAGPASVNGVSSGIPATNYRGSNPADFLFQIDALQQEVQQLRGMVEEQAYQIQQMREEQRDRYLDLDRRITLINQTPQTNTSVTPTETTGNTSPVAPVSTSAPKAKPSANEKAAYDAAFGLIRKKQYDNAIVSLKQFTQDYPDGTYTANVYYWLGEVELVKANYQAALSSFGQLLDKYPQHRKAPDAKYKQGKIYRELGDVAKAKAVLQDVVDQHPGTSAAKLARSELQNLKSS